jgi:hypothetical protein
MLDMTFTDVVTIRRPKPGTMGVHGRPEYEPVMDGDAPVTIRCGLGEVHGRVVLDVRGAEIEVDKVMKFRPQGKADLVDQDLVVDGAGQAYEVVSIRRNRLAFGAVTYASVDLKRTRIEVQEVGGGE